MSAAARRVKRCAIYIRVSTAMQRMEGWSLDAQRASLTAYAATRGWKVVAVYADEGKSARKRLKDRKEIHRLLEDVKRGDIDLILFKELDRWFRNVSDFYKVQDVLDAHDVTWVSERQPTLDMTTKEGRLNVNVLLSVGQNEADSTSDRIKYTNKYLIHQKRWTAGPHTLPRGYKLDENKHVVIDPEWEPFVRTLLDRVRRYGSIRKATVETNEEFEGQSMFYTNVLNMLKNPLLCGAYKDVEDFVAEPYLTRAEFDQIQKLVGRNASYNVRRSYIFSKLLQCPECGGSLVGSAINRKSGKYYKYYRCLNCINDKRCGNFRCVNEAWLEEALLEYVEEAVADRIATVKEVRQQRALRPRKSNRAAIERQLDKLEDLYISSERMTRERYEEKRAAILAKLIEDEPEPDPQELVGLEKIQALFDSGIKELYQSFTEEERREFWLSIVDKISIHNREIKGVDFIE